MLSAATTHLTTFHKLVGRLVWIFRQHWHHIHTHPTRKKRKNNFFFTRPPHPIYVVLYCSWGEAVVPTTAAAAGDACATIASAAVSELPSGHTNDFRYWIKLYFWLAYSHGLHSNFLIFFFLLLSRRKRVHPLSYSRYCCRCYFCRVEHQFAADLPQGDFVGGCREIIMGEKQSKADEKSTQTLTMCVRLFVTVFTWKIYNSFSHCKIFKSEAAAALWRPTLSQDMVYRRLNK